MIAYFKDPLLSAGRTVSKTTRNFFAVAATLVLLAIPFAIAYDDAVLAAVHAHFSIGSSYYPTGSVAGLMFLFSVVLALWWFFFRYLTQIVETVVQGDPFIAENKHRLQRMAGLLLVIQLTYIPIASLGLVVETAFKGPTSEVDIFWDYTAFLMAITLFVLARVFHFGAGLREELEGTV